jgi:hypothetical protein
LLVAFLGTQTVFGPLRWYHLEELLLVLTVCVSLPALLKTFVQKTVQALALAGLSVAVFLSLAIGFGYIHGGVDAFLGFIPNPLAYFLVVLHCRTRLRLKILILLLFGVCVFVIAQGVIELRANGGFVPDRPNDDEDLREATPEVKVPEPNQISYLIPQWNNEGNVVWRLKGQNFLGDPNDFGQLLVCTLPLTFIFWRPRRTVWNLLIVGPMIATIGFGLFFTHSRGALLAVIAVVFVAFRGKLGAIPSMVLGGGLFVGAMAMGASGGRDISAGAGSDRTALWGDGMQMLKAHPIFGAGWNEMADQFGMTAHNSVIVCAAELGMFGLFFWSLFLLPTVRDALAVASPTGLTDEVPQPVDESPYAYAAPTMKKLDKAEINQLGRLIWLSLVGFMVSAMFLSRAFVMTLFLLGGMAEVVFQMALERGMIQPRLSLGRTIAYSGVLWIVMIPGMYAIIRVLNLMH